LISFLLMLYLGFKFLLASSIPEKTASAERFEQRWHLHSAFWVGFSRVLLNPNVLLGWITLSATFLAHDWVDTSGHERLACVIGVGLGAGLWFFLLSHAVSRRHRQISAATLLRMEHYSGVFLLTVALCMGINIIYQLAMRR